MTSSKTEQPRTVAGRDFARRIAHFQILGDIGSILAIEAEAATGAKPDLLDEQTLVDIIEQAIFETDTGLEAALLASERILAASKEERP